jgi:hypothetical protein
MTMCIQRLHPFAVMLAMAMSASARTGMLELSDYSIPTSRPISPAEGTTTPNAQAAQRQNPYLGSVPGKFSGTVLQISLAEVISRGLHYNLGLVKSNHAAADGLAVDRSTGSNLEGRGPQYRPDFRRVFHHDSGSRWNAAGRRDLSGECVVVTDLDFTLKDRRNQVMDSAATTGGRNYSVF